MPVAYFDVSTAGVGMEEGLARGRERVAMTTPDETTATAVFVKRWEGVFFFRSAGVEQSPERDGKAHYYLLERVSLPHEDAAEEHRHG